MDKVLTVSQHFVFVNLTSFIAIVAAIALWIGFILMGLISRRYEQVYGMPTRWPFQMIAPAGVFVYLLMQAVASMQHQNMGPIELWTGYALLVWSAGFCFWGAFRFWKVILGLAKEQH